MAAVTGSGKCLRVDQAFDFHCILAGVWTAAKWLEKIRVPFHHPNWLPNEDE
jgi:hypothetical protein